MMCSPLFAAYFSQYLLTIESESKIFLWFSTTNVSWIRINSVIQAMEMKIWTKMNKKKKKPREMKTQMRVKIK